MTVSVMHPAVRSYLQALDTAVRTLPRKERNDLVEQVTEHIDNALPPNASEADVLNVLDELGTPEDIAAAAGVQPVRARRGAREIFALIFLVLGVPPIIGWAVGVGLLIWSPLWSVRQKLLGILVWPGGFFGAFLFAFALPVRSSGVQTCNFDAAQFTQHCVTTGSSGPPGWVAPLVLIVLFAGPLVVASYLWRAAGRNSAP